MIDLLSDDDSDAIQRGNIGSLAPPFTKPPSNNNAAEGRPNPYILDRKSLPIKKETAAVAPRRPQKKRKAHSSTSCEPRIRQAGIVLEEDVGTNDQLVTSYVEAQQVSLAKGLPAELFTDDAFPTLPSSIRGPKNENKMVKCRCRGSPLAKLDFDKEGKPMYCCARKACKFYVSAFLPERFHWYRFGLHNGHCIVQPTGFSANDLQQGRVGDCWFLSALAVVAERHDLISSLFPCTTLNEYGIVQVNLFLDGYWKPVVIDNFLPCMIDPKEEETLRQTLQASIRMGGISLGHRNIKNQSSAYDPHSLSDVCRTLLRDTRDFLEHDRMKQTGMANIRVNMVTDAVQRPLTSSDLAYSKGLLNQLWVPLLEKAYAKSHGSYQAISGGHVAEAFLDLTGAPTLVFRWLDTPKFDFCDFWYQLLRFRKQRLPMGCGTDQSQVGIIGMHAYSILDVVEVKNVSQDFYRETGAAHGGMSGFGTDGTVRLLQIRNPHGKSEWKGDFSDRSDVWEKLRKYAGGQCLSGPASGPHQKDHEPPSELERTMKDDGKFWIDYDCFLQGFGNVDVVLAFLGNHAKSFGTSFPAKKSNQRCVSAFEVCLLDESREVVELYVMGIQKTRRGAGHGRTDRKVSYKVCDLGLLIGERQIDPNRDIFDDSHSNNGEYWLHHDFSSVKGQMFGFQRNGHLRLVLHRSHHKSFVVMPVSFGHPSATDSELSFVVRFVSDAPVFIRELPAVPRLDKVIQKFCLSPTLGTSSNQGRKTLLMKGPSFRIIKVDCSGDGGGVIFLYLCVDERTLANGDSVSFSMEAQCRGISCRTAEGLLLHETIAKGKTFEAAWRKYAATFKGENQSRLLAVLFQSGQDFEFGSVSFKSITETAPKTKPPGILEEFMSKKTLELECYVNRGIFNGIKGECAFQSSSDFAMEAASSDFQPISMDATEIESFFVQQALELSMQEEFVGNAPEEVLDFDLCRALAASRANFETSGSQSQPVDDEFKRAIQLSLQERGSLPETKPEAAQVVPPKKVDVPDLTRVLPTTTSRSSDSTAVDDLKPVASGETSDNYANTIEAKRRLAAEAAMRRFGLK